MRVRIFNRASAAASLHVLPQLWARNIWSWKPNAIKPRLVARGDTRISINHPQHPPLTLIFADSPELLFCENETNTRRLYGAGATGFFKDGINEYVVNDNFAAVNPDQSGTKVAAHYRWSCPPKEQ